MTTEIKLRGCPCCTSELGPFVSSPDGRRQVLCSTCGMRGPYESSVTVAEDGWNSLPRAGAVNSSLRGLSMRFRYV